MAIEETDETQRALAIYVNRAADLADAVKVDIQKKGYITDKTVIALNNFIIASNNIADLTNALNEINIKLN